MRPASHLIKNLVRPGPHGLNVTPPCMCSFEPTTGTDTSGTDAGAPEPYQNQNVNAGNCNRSNGTCNPHLLFTQLSQKHKDKAATDKTALAVAVAVQIEQSSTAREEQHPVQARVQSKRQRRRVRACGRARSKRLWSACRFRVTLRRSGTEETRSRRNLVSWPLLRHSLTLTRTPVWTWILLSH